MGRRDPTALCPGWRHHRRWCTQSSVRTMCSGNVDPSDTRYPWPVWVLVTAPSCAPRRHLQRCHKDSGDRTRGPASSSPDTAGLGSFHQQQASVCPTRNCAEAVTEPSASQDRPLLFLSVGQTWQQPVSVKARSGFRAKGAKTLCRELLGGKPALHPGWRQHHQEARPSPGS